MNNDCFYSDWSQVTFRFIHDWMETHLFGTKSNYFTDSNITCVIKQVVTTSREEFWVVASLGAYRLEKVEGVCHIDLYNMQPNLLKIARSCSLTRNSCFDFFFFCLLISLDFWLNESKSLAHPRSNQSNRVPETNRERMRFMVPSETINAF